MKTGLSARKQVPMRPARGRVALTAATTGKPAWYSPSVRPNIRTLPKLLLDTSMYFSVPIY